MDRVTQVYEENKQIIICSLHLLVIIPLIFLAIRPEYIPLMVPVNLVLYVVYALLLAGIVKHGYCVAMYIKNKVEESKAASVAVEAPKE